MLYHYRLYLQKTRGSRLGPEVRMEKREKWDEKVTKLLMHDWSEPFLGNHIAETQALVFAAH